MNEQAIEKLCEIAVKEFKQKYPRAATEDLWTFAVGYKAGVVDMKMLLFEPKEMIAINEQVKNV